ATCAPRALHRRASDNAVLFANNYAIGTFNNGRDFDTALLNQNAEVDILKGGANAFTNDAADIVSVLYGPGADTGANPNPWTSYSIDLGTLAPGVYQIRFAETDNVNFFNLGIDNVQVESNVTVPGPIGWTSRPDLGERWPSRLAATAAEDSL